MVRRKNNDAKRSSRKHQKKNYTQPKDTTRRSHNNHAKNPHLKDNTGSVPGSSNTIKGKSAAGGPAEKVPFLLYQCIEAALEARKVWEARRDQCSELELQRAESMVNSSVYYYTHMDPVLPHNWEYNPATAGTLEPIDNIPPALGLVEEPEQKTKTKRFEDGDDDSDASSDSSFGCGPDVPSMILRKLIDVPLKEYDIESWLQFKKFDEGYERPTFVPGCKPDEIKFPVNIDYPFVSAIGYFAVNCFNEAFEEFVEKGEHKHLRDPAFTKCTYFKPGDSFWFDMTILADEYGFRGIYQVRVECTIDNGERTLHHFVLTDIKCGKKENESKSKSSKDVGLLEGTGMWPRRSTITRASPITYGYDYHNPTEFICF